MRESAPHSGWVWIWETQRCWIIHNYSYSYYKRMNVYKREGQAEGRLQCRSSGRPRNNVPVCRSLPVYNTYTVSIWTSLYKNTATCFVLNSQSFVSLSRSLYPVYTCDCVCVCVFFFPYFSWVIKRTTLVWFKLNLTEKTFSLYQWNQKKKD